MMTKPKRTLERQDPRESILQNDIVIRFSVTTGLIIAMVIFIGVCFLIKGPTYGFL